MSTQQLRKLATQEAKRFPMGDRKSDMLSVISDNALNYKLPQNASVVSHRSRKKFFFEQSTYTDSRSTMIIDLQTGNDFINFAESYLVFDVTMVNAGSTTVGWGTNGSGFNLIERVVVNSRSGTELDRFENVNVYRYMTDAWQEYSNYRDRQGALEEGVDPVTDSAANLLNTTKIILPMKKLAPIFDTPGRLMPSFLASGLRISITLANGNFAAIADAGVSTTFTLTEPAIMLDTYTLIDSIANKLARVSGENGLEFYFEGIEHTQSSNADGNSTLELKKSVSRALGVITSHRLTDNLEDANLHSLATSVFDFTSFQYRVGSTYLTQQPIESVQEAYYLALSYAGKLGHNDNTDVSLADFKSAAVPINTHQGLGIIVGDLGRSHVQDLSSQPLNSSRTISLRYARPASENHRYDMFLKHVVLLRIFLNNVVKKL
jgi:hypothetical protein